ncbi:hypothetical protein oki184_36320 [Helicobacter pylori]|nr:hypothetical protein KUHPSE09_04760 [Staphylococcus epidermidis]
MTILLLLNLSLYLLNYSTQSLTYIIDVYTLINATTLKIICISIATAKFLPLEYLLSELVYLRVLGSNMK